MVQSRPAALSVHACAAFVLAVAIVGCKREAPEPEDAPLKDEEPTSDAELATSSSTGDAPALVGDLCESAPAVATSLSTGTLFGAEADLTIDDVGDCGLDGPDAFVRMTTSSRVDVTVSAVGSGFVPAVAIIGSSCIEAFACASGLPATALDVAPDTDLVIAVGIRADDPALVAAAAPEDLAYELRIETSAVLGHGEGCGLPGQGRCATGTACLVDDASVATCTIVDGDTCATASPIDLSQSPTIVTIDPAVPYSDAHQHACAGARRRDRVVRVQWPAPGGTLVASTTAPEVALAIRGPGCAATEALACTPASDEGATIETLVEGASGAFVFVELPADDPTADVAPPFDVVLDLVP